MNGFEQQTNTQGETAFSGLELARQLETQRLEVTSQRAELMSGARERLASWGVMAHETEQLAEVAGQYSYDRCEEKVSSIVERGAFLLREDNQETVVLPEVMDYADRSAGQCGDIALKVLDQIHDSGWLQRVNDSLAAEGRPRLNPLYLTGRSRTHFNNEDSVHCWTGLMK